MKKFNYLLTLFVVCLGTTITSSAADVLVYQYRRVSMNIGQGVEFVSSSRGFLIWNLEDNHFTWVDSGVVDGQRRYRVTDASPLVVTASGWNGREFTSFSGTGSTNGRYFQEYYRGLNAHLKSAWNRSVFYPRTMKGNSHTIVTSIGPRLSDHAVTYVYSQARTIAANNASLSEDAVLATLRAELETKGYFDLQGGSVAKASSLSATLESSVVDTYSERAGSAPATPAP